MSATRQHAAIESLVRIFGAAVGPVPVYDGPNTTEDDEGAAVWVGYDPTDEDATAVETEQEWHDVGAMTKEETGIIRCAVAAWSGDTETLARRLRVAGLLTDLEAAHRAEVNLPLVAGDDDTAAVIYSNFGARGSLHQQVTADGNEVLALFTVTYYAHT